MTFYLLSLLLYAGRSGRGENTETGSHSDFKAENLFILSSFFYDFCFTGVNYSSLLLHLFSHWLQSGKWLESSVMLTWSCWVFSDFFVSHLCQTENVWGARNPWLDYWISTFNCHHGWKLCGSFSVWPDRLIGAICSQHHCHTGSIEVGISG